MKARLNLFQATILRWRELHPYNAVLVVRSARPLDADKLAGAICRHIEWLGLTRLHLDTRARRYEWRGGPTSANLHVVATAGDASELLRTEIERQLNLAYPAHGDIEPFRFFVIESAHTFAFGVSYDHFVAGGDSIVGLLRGIVAAYRGSEPQEASRLQRYPPTYGVLFRRRAGALLAGLPQLRAMAAGCRRSFRPQFRTDDDGYTGFIDFRLDPGETGLLTHTASSWRATHNDLFLAILLKCLSPLAAGRRDEPRRKELGVASIVNIRRDFGPDLQPSFGPVLASFRVSHPVPDAVTLRELVTVINAETLRIKTRPSCICRPCLRWHWLASSGAFLSVPRRRRFFAKHYPVWAGTTPLNVTALWGDEIDGQPPPEYIRAVPTGPLSPIALAVTTAGDDVHVGITFRTAAFRARDDRSARGRYSTPYSHTLIREIRRDSPSSCRCRERLACRLRRGPADHHRTDLHRHRQAEHRIARAATSARDRRPYPGNGPGAHHRTRDVREALALGPTPHIILLHGGLYGNNLLMVSFAEFLVGMGYPESKLRDPSDGALSQSPYTDSARLAGEIAWYYEHDGVRPMLIGHSQGGMQAVKALYELTWARSPSVWRCGIPCPTPPKVEPRSSTR